MHGDYNSAHARGAVRNRELTQEQRGGGLGGEYPISRDEKPRAAYSIWTKGGEVAVISSAQIMSSFALLEAKSDFLSEFLPLLTA